MVTIPFNRVNDVGKKNEFFAIRVRAETRNNSNITKPQLAILCNLSKNLLNILMFGNRR